MTLAEPAPALPPRPAPERPGGGARLALRLLGLALALALFGYFARFAWAALTAQEAARLLAPDVLAALALSALLSVMVVAVSAWAWRHLLADMGEPRGLRPVFAVLATTQIAKYLPGNVAQHVGRVAYALSLGMNPSVLAASLVLETLLLVGAGVAVGALAWLVAAPVATAHALSPGPAALLALAALLVVAAAFAFALPRLQAALARIPGARARLKLDARLPRAGAVFRVSLAYLACYFMLGAGLWLLVVSLGGGAGLGWLRLTGAFAVAWLAGYLAPGVPAGLGTREGALAMMLGGQGDDAVVLTAIVGTRVASVLADQCCLGLGLVLSRMDRDRLPQ